MTDRYARLGETIGRYIDNQSDDEAFMDIFRILDEEFSSMGDHTPDTYCVWPMTKESAADRDVFLESINIANADDLRKHDDLTVVLAVYSELFRKYKAKVKVRSQNMTNINYRIMEYIPRVF